MTSTATARHSAAMWTSLAVTCSQRSQVLRLTVINAPDVSKNNMDIEKRYGRRSPSSTPYFDCRVTTRRRKVKSAAIFAAFALYAAFLLKLLLFSRVPGSERSINLVPFASIAAYASSHAPGAARTGFANIVGNILIFISLGFYASWLRHRATTARIMLIVASISVAVEVLQGILGVGASDIDDVMLNSVGGFIGILALTLLTATLRTQSRVRSAVAALSLLAIPVWCYLLVVIRLHM
ncbi:glycopeptide antibiotics resistance protein [Phycicoccus badiiscoriae]|uniref:Glycopeptide antibiotics resistance protein n=1 Tax=Pedococcus badiiscoriae TaxID=642776 RepID=A0A852WIQ0_9MICO|nr:VanZ family protein [Pedococcus badiiscoriae]NYG07481.1 glycopeptide antibiotics resistance protein [Pedococcus badiiscoriae]